MLDSEKSVMKILRGANLIQLYTGMVYQGPNIASKISQELINILEKKGVKNISEIIGNQNNLDWKLYYNLYNSSFLCLKNVNSLEKYLLKVIMLAMLTIKLKEDFYQI